MNSLKTLKNGIIPMETPWEIIRILMTIMTEYSICMMHSHTTPLSGEITTMMVLETILIPMMIMTGF